MTEVTRLRVVVPVVVVTWTDRLSFVAFATARV